MKKLTLSRSMVVGVCGLFLATFGLWQIGSTALAEQTGSSPESGATSRIKTIYDSLSSLSHGSDVAGGWGDWGSMWNRIRSAGEWVPAGDASEADVVAGKVFYKDTRTPKTGSLSLSGDATVSDVIIGKTFYSNSLTKLTGTAPNPTIDWSTFSKVTWDDNKNGGSPDGDNAGEESVWLNTAGSATTGVWQDTRTGLYWSNSRGDFSNLFTVASCDFFTSNPRGSYAGGDSDCGVAINTCSSLSLDANGDSTPETDWYLPTQKELQLAYINGMYNQTNTTFVPTSYFWSSTEHSDVSSSAWAVYLGNGTTGTNNKGNGHSVRCVRRD